MREYRHVKLDGQKDGNFPEGKEMTNRKKNRSLGTKFVVEEILPKELRGLYRSPY